MKRVLVATSNPGKIRDLMGAAVAHHVHIETLPGFASLPSVVEDGATFEANAAKKAEYYSKHAEGELVIADDSGLEVDALGGAPGVHSARYAAEENNLPQDSGNSDDEANNARLLRELARGAGRIPHRSLRVRDCRCTQWSYSGNISRQSRRHSLA